MLSAHAEDKRDKQTKDLDSIKAQLKPLREEAYLESDVIEARKKLDAAYKTYWDAVRAAMIRLDPAQEPLIKKEIALRKEIAPVSAGSRASDYEKKAEK